MRLRAGARLPRTLLAATLLVSAWAFAADPPAPQAGAAPTASPPASAVPAPASVSAADPTRHEPIRAYAEAMTKRRLVLPDLRREDVEARLHEVEEMLDMGRTDEAVARLSSVVEHPNFLLFDKTELGRAARYLLGDALGRAGVSESSRAYLRAVIADPGAWEGAAIYGRRASRRLVEVALSNGGQAALPLQQGLLDLRAVPPSAPQETLGEIAYLEGRTKEAEGDTAAALAAYAKVPQQSRHWSQATYLQGLIHVEAGRFKEGEQLFCKVADPKRQDRTTPVLADERFFAVRDLARLALGRVAHEEFRFDDARYYYYLVPRDSDRLAEALYEGATTRYEKKDYQGARELLDELFALKIHHRYEDEARILDAYIDLAMCRFPSADQKLRAFIATYEPIREAARRMQDAPSDATTLLAQGTSEGVSIPGLGAETARTLSSILRSSPSLAIVSRKLAVLDQQASGLTTSRSQLKPLRDHIAQGGGVMPALSDGDGASSQEELVRDSLVAARRAIEELEAAGAKNVAQLRAELVLLEAKAVKPAGVGAARNLAQTPTGRDLPDLVQTDSILADNLGAELAEARADLVKAETALAKDALIRADLRLSRLLRRARLGRIESVLGKKRALEVEIEAIRGGYLPQDAVDSLEPTRFLEDNEEYWPFEGDDWPDEFVGGEVRK